MTSLLSQVEALDIPARMALDFDQITAAAFEAKVLIARHYNGEKLETGIFFRLKSVETIYNLRSWAEGDKAGPKKLHAAAQKAAKNA